MEPYSRLAISVLTEAEIRFGVARRPESPRLKRSFEQFLGGIEILSIGSAVAKIYAQLRTDLKATGKSLAPIDMLIASHALAAGAVLVSHDRAFQQLSPWLTVVDWATDL